jgi:transcriptional regulator with XRE-family HTH domain
MAELRQRVLDSEQGRRAYDNLTAEIDAHIDRRRARLGEVRRAVGLTQEQVAAMLGIGQAQVSKIERSVNLQLETLERFIAATGGRLRVIAAYDDIEIDIALDELAPGDRTESTRIT